MTDKIIMIVPFVFGAVVGSFLNVCIYRIPAGVSIVRPSSRCSMCGRKIPFYYNIPVLSFFMLLGRCSYCRGPLSFQYPFVEALTGLFAVLLFKRYGLAAEVFIYFAFLSAIIVITFIDLKERIIPDVISLPGIIIGLAASFFLTSPGVLASVTGAVLGAAVLMVIAWVYYLLTHKEGMGGGDVKLLAMIGAFLGWKGVLFTLFASSLLGAAVGMIVIIGLGKGSRYALPFGPFLAIGAIVYLFYGHAIIGWYLLRVTGGL